MDSPTNVNITESLEYWMTNLPQKLKTISIIHLAIPGSHDSFTYSINRHSQIAPDAEPIVRMTKFLGPITRFLAARWSKTQNFDVTLQLNHGVRYFDLRIATKANDDQLYFVHGLYSENVTDTLKKIEEFLETHSQEVVILDCQHFYNFSQTDHEILMQLLRKIFRVKILPYSTHMEHLTLKYLTIQFHYQILIIYRSNAARFGQPLMWPAECFPTPWPNTISISDLFIKLNQSLLNKNPDYGFVSQCLLTPTPMFVLKNIYSNLKSKCVLPLEKSKYEWLAKQKPGKNGVNIIISDFVDLNSNKFTKYVIKLNEKLLHPELLNSI